MNITQKPVNVVKQTWTPYQFILQIEITCGGIELQFLKQELCPLQVVSRTLPIAAQVAYEKNKNHSNTQNLKPKMISKAWATTYDVDEEWSVKSIIHA